MKTQWQDAIKSVCVAIFSTARNSKMGICCCGGMLVITILRYLDFSLGQGALKWELSPALKPSGQPE